MLDVETSVLEWSLYGNLPRNLFRTSLPTNEIRGPCRGIKRKWCFWYREAFLPQRFRAVFWIGSWKLGILGHIGTSIQHNTCDASSPWPTGQAWSQCWSIIDDESTVRKGSKFGLGYYIHLQYLGEANFVGYMCKIQVWSLLVQAIISPLPDIHA